MAEIIATPASGTTMVQIINQVIFIRNETPIRLSSQDKRTFTTNYPFVPNTLCVTLNGLRQKEGIAFDYEELGDQQFRFTHSLDEEDALIIDYLTVMNSIG